ncbi:hypothetical protein Tsp_02718 [Trichinella spiralis]|uniref:hypothetical protein n=1 Tax=Trichinella spiralis TaxID=6334 RepID=UPI0001EFC185|nr:hypothetical protein Tsp_02718 [Trichinella spiralis]
MSTLTTITPDSWVNNIGILSTKHYSARLAALLNAKRIRPDEQNSASASSTDSSCDCISILLQQASIHLHHEGHFTSLDKSFERGQGTFPAVHHFNRMQYVITQSDVDASAESLHAYMYIIREVEQISRLLKLWETLQKK